MDKEGSVPYANTMKKVAFMFLHLGNNLSVRAADVVSIHDMKLFAPGGPSRPFFESAQAAGRVRSLTGGRPPKSLVITRDAIYLSAISPATLLRRARSSYTFVENSRKQQKSRD